MKSRTFNYADNIIITIDDNGEPLYNGDGSMYNALMTVYPKFKMLTGGKQMEIVANATVALNLEASELQSLDLQNAFPPKVYIYECMYNKDGSAWGKIICADTGNLLIEVSEDEIGALRDETDIEGLKAYLVKRGELLPYDKLIGEVPSDY